MIFLSYSWKDQAAAHKLDAVLRGHGLDVWIDFRELDLRRDITNQLERAIRGCSLFLAFQPPHRQDSPWMTAELLIANEQARPILQVTTGLTALDQIDIPSIRSLLNRGSERNTMKGRKPRHCNGRDRSLGTERAMNRRWFATFAQPVALGT